MRALLLAGGYGKRLRPLTNTIPKCLIKVKEVTLLESWYQKLKKNNIDDIYCNSHYLHQTVADFISKKKLIMNNLYEKKLLGTGGTMIRNLEKFIDQELIVIHCDNYTKDDLKSFIKLHESRPKNCLVTIFSFITDYPEQCGIIQENNNIVTNIFEKVKGVNGNLANGAIYLFSKDALKFINENLPKAKDIILDILPHFFNKIYLYKTNKRFTDIGTHENLYKANLF